MMILPNLNDSKDTSNSKSKNCDNLAALFLTFLLASISWGCQTPRQKNLNEVPQLAVMQGITNSDSTQLILLAEKAAEITFEITLNLNPVELATSSRVISWPGSKQEILQINVKQMQPEKAYLIRFKDKKGTLIDQRSFKGVTPQNGMIKVAVTSCMDDGALDPDQIWSELLSQNPNLIWMIGDNVYADWRDGNYLGSPSPEVLWQRYVETRQRLSLFREFFLKPIYSIWDDHDYGVNDGDQTNPYKKEALQIYQAFFGIPESSLDVEKGMGVSYSIEMGEHRFIFLDGRLFRQPNQIPPICKLKPQHFACKKQNLKRPGREGPFGHLGAEQEKWAFTQITKSKQAKQLAWLIKGDQFFGGYHPFESFEGSHPAHFERFMSSMRSLKAPVIFVSGDRHISEIMRIPAQITGSETYEITSSPIHAKVFPSDRKEFPNPLAIEYIAEKHNYVTIEIPLQIKNDQNIKVRGHALPKEILFERPLPMSLDSP